MKSEKLSIQSSPIVLLFNLKHQRGWSVLEIFWLVIMLNMTLHFYEVVILQKGNL